MLDDEGGEESGDESVEEGGFGERETEPLKLGDLLAQFGLADGGLDGLAEDQADPDAGAEAAAEAEAGRFAGVCDIPVRPLAARRVMRWWGIDSPYWTQVDTVAGDACAGIGLPRRDVAWPLFGRTCG